MRGDASARAASTSAHREAVRGAAAGPATGSDGVAIVMRSKEYDPTLVWDRSTAWATHVLNSSFNIIQNSETNHNERHISNLGTSRDGP